MSKEVWVTILFQIINAFIFKNITIKQYMNFSNNLNRKKSELIDELQNYKNINSTSEQILYKWIKNVLDKVYICIYNYMYYNMIYNQY